MKWEWLVSRQLSVCKKFAWIFVDFGFMFIRSVAAPIQLAKLFRQASATKFCKTDGLQHNISSFHSVSLSFCFAHISCLGNKFRCCCSCNHFFYFSCSFPTKRETNRCSNGSPTKWKSTSSFHRTHFGLCLFVSYNYSVGFLFAFCCLSRKQCTPKICVLHSLFLWPNNEHESYLSGWNCTLRSSAI